MRSKPPDASLGACSLAVNGDSVRRQRFERAVGNAVSTLGVALDYPLGLPCPFGCVGCEPARRIGVAKLATPRMLIFTVPRFRVQCLVSLFAALGVRATTATATVRTRSTCWKTRWRHQLAGHKRGIGSGQNERSPAWRGFQLSLQLACHRPLQRPLRDLNPGYLRGRP